MKLSALPSRLLATIAAGTLLATGLAAPASAGGIDIDIFDRFPPVDFGNKPCDQEHFGQHVCSPDFTTQVTTALSYPDTDDGVPATFFLVTVHNDSMINGDGSELVTYVALDQSRILKVEPFAGLDSWTVEYVSADRDSVFLRHPNGLKAGQFTTVAVWYAGYDFTEFSSITNVVESSIAGFVPLRFDQPESTTTNNESSGDLDWTPRMSKG